MNGSHEVKGEGGAPPVTGMSRVLEWFWRGRSLRALRSKLAATPELVRELQTRARAAAALAERVHARREPLPAGSADAFAAELYREALYWLLRSFAADKGEPSEDGAVWDAALQELGRLGEPPETTSELREHVLQRSFVDYHELPRQECARTASELQRLVRRALARAIEGEEHVDWLWFQRIWRVGVMVLALVIAIGAGWSSYSRRVEDQRDLAAGKPWRASSQWRACPLGTPNCDSLAGTQLLFHTNEEWSPWFQIDLGSPQQFSRVVVKNRSDCCMERATPLSLEVSDDGKRWTLVARREQEFRTWNARFEPQTARYVRLRAERRTTLHLERVKVLPD